MFYSQVTGDTGLDGASAVTGRDAAKAFDALSYEHFYLEYLGRAHDFNLVYESWPIVKGLTQSRTLDPNPARVTYQLDASTEDPSLGVTHDRAYWVSGLKLAPGAASGQIDATALPLTSKLPRSISHLEGHFLNPESGNNAFVSWSEYNKDLSGHGLGDFESGWIPGPDVVVTTTPLPLPANAGSNSFTATTSRLSTAELSMSRMGIRTDAPVTGTLDNDKALTLTLRGSWPSSAVVTVDGVVVTATNSGSAIVVMIAAGHHVLRIS